MILNISFSLFFICKIIRATFYCDGDALEGDVANVATNVECRQQRRRCHFRSSPSSLLPTLIVITIVCDE